MRKLLLLACRAFPRDHRARRSDEVVDTALLVANGSALRAAREALSLVVAGLQERLRGESRRSLRDGLTPLAWLLALVNLAVALAGLALGVHPPAPMVYFGGLLFGPFFVDWWWIAFAVAALGIVLGLVRGNRPLALGAALANLGLVAYDAFFFTEHGFRPLDVRHLDVFAWQQPLAFPSGRHWLAPAVVLALATAAAPLRRLPLRSFPLLLIAGLMLAVVSRETSFSDQTPGDFLFLSWLLAAIVLLAVAFGSVAPRLVTVAIGCTLAVVPGVVGYLAAPYHPHDPAVTWPVVAGLVLGVLLPLAQLTRRRLA